MIFGTFIYNDILVFTINNQRKESKLAKRKGSGYATINDVAKLAEVGSITVSRFLREPKKVSIKLQKRITKSILNLNYVPDPKARALASGKSNVIGVLIPSLSNNVFSDTLRGIHDMIKNTQYQIQIGNTRYSLDEEDRLVSLFIRQRPAAMILTSLGTSEKSCKLLKNSNVPIVQIMELEGKAIDTKVGYSSILAAEEVVTHLIEKGYLRIGYMAARMDRRSILRRDSYRKQMQKNGIYDKQLEITTLELSSVGLGRKLFRTFKKTNPDADAIFCSNDDLALGVIFECMDQGISIPEDMGVVGFNDLEMMAACVPSISSVRTNRYQIGQLAIKNILQRLDGNFREPKQVDVGFQLIARQSSNRATDVATPI